MDRYSDDERTYVIQRSGWDAYKSLVTADTLIHEAGFDKQIYSYTSDGGATAYLHVYKKPSFLWGGGEFIGSVAYKPSLQGDVDRAFAIAKSAATLGLINSLATDVRMAGNITFEVGMFLIPGPQDAILGAAITRVLGKVGPKAWRASYNGVKWVFTRGGKTLAREEEAAAAKEMRTMVMKEFGEEASALDWSPHNFKHVLRRNVEWKVAVKETRRAEALYKPTVVQDVEAFERYVWQNGIPTNHTDGRTWKVMEFKDVIGASDGLESRWVRVEVRSNTLHGSPITEQKFREYTRAK